MQALVTKDDLLRVPFSRMRLDPDNERIDLGIVEWLVERTILLADARMEGKATITVLSGADAGAVNSMEAPETVAPVSNEVVEKGKKLDLNLPAYSLTLARIKVK